MNTAQANIATVKNNQQKLEYIKNLWVRDKTVTAAYKCAFKMNNKKQ